MLTDVIVLIRTHVSLPYYFALICSIYPGFSCDTGKDSEVVIPEEKCRLFQRYLHPSPRQVVLQPSSSTCGVRNLNVRNLELVPLDFRSVSYMLQQYRLHFYSLVRSKNGLLKCCGPRLGYTWHKQVRLTLIFTSCTSVGAEYGYANYKFVCSFREHSAIICCRSR